MALLITLICVVVLCCVGLVLVWRFNKMESFVVIAKKVKAKLGYFYRETVKYPAYIMTHPVKGYNEFKNEKKGKMWVAIFILLMFVLEEIVAYKFSGPALAINDQTKFSTIKTLVFSVIPVVLIAVSNWTVTTLMNGKGKMKEIFMMICYSLQPFVILNFVKVLLSNFVTADEAQFLTLINIVAIAILCYMVFMGMVVIHEYGIAKTLLSVILTALALCIILFIALLIFDLSQQVYGFAYTIYKEIATRMI